jgi:hypothetical protein
MQHDLEYSVTQRRGAKKGAGGSDQPQPEALGIVISPGAQDMGAPRVAAYVWAPASTGEDGAAASIAA